MVQHSYQIAAVEVSEEIIVNRSRFICFLAPCDSAIQFKTFLKRIQAEHPQASHHCYTFLAGHPEDSQLYGFSDDGEPSGTAGKPMLATLQGSKIGQVAAIVVRYFGGTKLGTGGLQRAYGASVRQALTLLPTKTKIPMEYKTLACQYTLVDEILRLVASIEGQLVNQEFGGEVNLTLAIPVTQISCFSQQLETISSGQITLKNVVN